MLSAALWFTQERLLFASQTLPAQHQIDSGTDVHESAIDAPDMQRFVVGEKGWLTDAAFTSSVAIAQSAPGPNVLFVAVIGWNVGGVAGLLAAMVGSLLPSTTLTLAAMRYGERNHDSLGVRAFTAGLAPLTVGLLLSTSWVLAQPSRHYLGMPVLFAFTLAMMLLTKMSPMWPMALGALAGAMGLLG